MITTDQAWAVVFGRCENRPAARENLAGKPNGDQEIGSFRQIGKHEARGALHATHWRRAWRALFSGMGQRGLFRGQRADGGRLCADDQFHDRANPPGFGGCRNRLRQGHQHQPITV